MKDPNVRPDDKAPSSPIGKVRDFALIGAAVVFAAYFAVSLVQSFDKEVSDNKEVPVVVGEIKISDPVEKTDQASESLSSENQMVQTSVISEKLLLKRQELEKTPAVVLKSVAAQERAREAAAAQPSRAVAPQQATGQMIQQGNQRAMQLGVKPDGTLMSEAEKAEQIKNLLAALPDSYTVNWLSENEQIKLFVFTDPTCPYCKRLHDAVPQLNAAGISVHYFMYPRDLPKSTASTLSPTAIQLNNVWCSLDQKAAFNEAFHGYRVRETNCADLPPELNRIPSPVTDHYFLGSLFDVQGTPTMATSKGLKIEGFKSAEDLISKVLN